jgi:hypothetical protein
VKQRVPSQPRLPTSLLARPRDVTEARSWSTISVANARLSP